ncbi:MAG: NADH:ubiquinone oxidoreductase [Loktanella sp.]|nr:NADH:ubiquinone oxidoreductase [Loktanella sp.]
MNNTAPIWMGIAAIAGLVFVVGTGVALVMFDFPLVSAVFVGAVVAGIAVVALAVGWAPPRDDAAVTKAATPAETPSPAAVTTPDPVAEPTPAPTPVAEPAQAALADPTPVATPDPVAAAPAKPAASGKPAVLVAPRDGGADDLKLLKGVGPKMEMALNGHGIYHFDQIAAWTPAEQAWVDENVDGVKGRATRDDWVAQAKALIAGVAN